MLFTFRASLCYLPAQRRDSKRLPVDCFYVAVWWCTCESWNGHAGGSTLLVQYIYEESYVFRDYGWAALLSPRVLLSRIPYTYCSSVLISGTTLKSTKNIGCCAYPAWKRLQYLRNVKFPFCLASPSVACGLSQKAGDPVRVCATPCFLFKTGLRDLETFVSFWGLLFCWTYRVILDRFIH